MIVDKPGGRERAGLKLVCILRRNKALDLTTFHDHWLRNHGGIFQNVPALNEPLLAYDQKCTHLSCAVVPEVEHVRLACPCHKGYFDLATGRPVAGPPRRPLPRVTVHVRDGVVYATGVEGQA